MTRDYYEVLGVKPSASAAEIRSAYKRLARKHHPDVNPGSKSAEESFKEISAAYNVLGDPQKRRQYDAMRSMGGFAARGRPGAGAGSWPFGGFGTRSVEVGPGVFDDLGGIFADLFGRGAPGAAGPRRGADLEYEASIDFEEAIRGTTIKAPLARNVTCSACGGEGVTSSTARRRGTACRRCDGEGAVRSADTITVRIPPGATDGSRVRVPGAGDAGRGGGPVGDLYIVLRVKPHRYFRREGREVVLDVPLSYAEAALGARIEVPTMAGRASLAIPPGTRSGQRFRLRGKGVPSSQGKPRGDQIVVAQIVPPGKTDARVKELIREIDRLDTGDPRGDLNW